MFRSILGLSIGIGGWAAVGYAEDFRPDDVAAGSPHQLLRTALLRTAAADDGSTDLVRYRGHHRYHHHYHGGRHRSHHGYYGHYRPYSRGHHYHGRYHGNYYRRPYYGGYYRPHYGFGYGSNGFHFRYGY